MIAPSFASGPFLERSLLLLALVAAGQQKPQRPPKPREPGSPRYENPVKLPDDYVRYARVPDGGVGPRVVLGTDELALLYFRGGEGGGDLFLARSGDEARSFAPSQRVNAEPGTVAAPHGAHTGALDLGADGTAHVVWFERGDAPRLLYARLGRGEDAAVRLDLGAPAGLGSTPAVAVDGNGRVHVVYAAAEGPQEGEGAPVRRVWMRSSDDGAAFSEPEAIDRKSYGVSAESALAAHADEHMGTIYVLYRTEYQLKEESKNFSRGMRLIAWDGRGDEFDGAWVDNWRQPRDPRSLAGLAQDPNTTLATWDSGGQVFWATIRRQLGKVNLPMEPRFDGPAVVRSSAAGAGTAEDVFLAWIERPKDDPAAAPRLAWRVWQRFSRAPLGDGYASEAPGAGTPAAFAREGGGYTVLY